MMSIKNLETFILCVRLGSFSATARKLNSSQPAISMRIRELERSLGVELFNRRKKTIQLTRKGRELLDYAVRITSLSNEAHVRLGDGRALAGRLRVGVTESVALTWLPDFVAALNEQFPHVVIELDVALTSGVWNRLWAGDLDLALMPGPVRGPWVTARSLGRIQYTWMASPSLNVPKRAQRPRDLQAWPVITLSQDSVLHQITEEWFLKNGAEPNRLDVCNSLGVVAKMTGCGLGISLLPPAIFRKEVEAGELVALNVTPELPPLEFVVVHCSRAGAVLENQAAELAQKMSTFEKSDQSLLRGRRRPARGVLSA